jgi:hypothetical protein
MKFTLTIDMNNAAFEDGPEELGRIVIGVGQAIIAGHMPGRVRDFNGNTVGGCQLDEITES